jgi:hypothetical protein
VSEVVGAFVWGEGIEDVTDGIPEQSPRSRCGLARQRLELGKRELDWVEVARIGRQVKKQGSAGCDGGAYSLDLMGRQIVDHDDVAGRQVRRQHGLDIDQEGLSVHRPVENPGRDEPVAAQGGGESGGLPMSPRRLADQPKAASAPSMGAYQLGRGSSLVDEDQPLDDKPQLFGRPALPCFGHVGTFLFGGVQRFFEADRVPPEEPINRTVRGAHPALRLQPLDDLRQREVRLVVDQLQQP